MTDSKTILVIEDETALLEVIKKKLGLSGFYVLTARSVKEGLERLGAGQKTDLIWLDHRLIDGENGLAFAKKIKETEEYGAIPIFVVASVLSREEAESYLKLGAVKYYIKAESSLARIIEDIKKFLS